MYPRIIENDSSEPKTHPPGKIVTLFIFMKNFYTVKDKKNYYPSLPGFIVSQSTYFSCEGYGPNPNNPFSAIF